MWLGGSALALGEYESVGPGGGLVPAASFTVEEVVVSVTRVSQLLSLLRTSWVSMNFNCSIRDAVTNTDMILRHCYFNHVDFLNHY